MTGAELKAKVTTIPNEATVFVAGADGGGYDWVYLDDLVINVAFDGSFCLMGIGETKQEAWEMKGDEHARHGD